MYILLPIVRGNHLSDTNYLSKAGILQKLSILRQTQAAVLDEYCHRKQTRPR